MYACMHACVCVNMFVLGWMGKAACAAVQFPFRAKVNVCAHCLLLQTRKRREAAVEPFKKVITAALKAGLRATLNCLESGPS